MIRQALPTVAPGLCTVQTECAYVGERSLP